MAYEMGEIRLSQQIFYYLLEHHELKEEEEQRLYRAYTEEEVIQNLVKSQAEEASNRSRVEANQKIIEQNTALSLKESELKHLVILMYYTTDYQ